MRLLRKRSRKCPDGEVWRKVDISELAECNKNREETYFVDGRGRKSPEGICNLVNSPVNSLVAIKVYFALKV